MLLAAPSRNSALHVPVLMLTLSALLLVPGVTAAFGMWARPADKGWMWLLAIGAGTLLFALSQLKLIRVRGGQLTCLTVYGSKELTLARAALGISARYSSKGGPTYTVYAFAGAEDVELAQAGSTKGAERLREKLNALLFQGRLDDRPARTAQETVERREARWRRHEADTKATVDNYYASKGWKRMKVWIPALVAVYVLGMSLYLAWSSR